MDEIILKREGASYWGIERIDNKGKKHYQRKLMRGNGSLVLTNTEVSFTRWAPKKIFSIPVEKITQVELYRWHNRGSAVFMPILRIFYHDKGETNILGVCVGWKKEGMKWKLEIDRLAESKRH